MEEIRYLRLNNLFARDGHGPLNQGSRKIEKLKNLINHRRGQLENRKIKLYEFLENADSMK